MLKKLGSLRSALAVGVGVTFLLASSAFAQVGSTAATPAAPAATPAAGTGAGAVSDSAIADSSAGGAATTERVVVTGSYIPTAETESALPVTVYTATVLQKQGANTPAEGLRQLPSFVGNTATENDSNGGDGSAFVNLRALGSGNTLTLINGRRAFAFEDINAIPIGALSRSEVLKDGASAIYGSDAVAGVVNFILLNGPGEAPYEGAEIDFLYGNTTDRDARVIQSYIRGGVATDKFSVAAAAEYYDREAIFSVDREISRLADRRNLGGTNQGSPTFPGRAQFRTNPAVNASATASILINQANANPQGPQDYRARDPNVDSFNFRQTTPAIPAMEKYQYYITGRYKIFGEALQIYGDLLYSKRKQDNGLAPAPFQFGVVAANASPYNPFFTGPPGGARTATTADDQLRSVQYRSIENGLRRSFFDYDYYRYVAGINGNFTFTGNNVISFLGYDTGMVYETGEFLRIDSGDLRRTPLEAEVAAGNFNPFRGLGAPLSGTATTFTNGVATGTDTFDNTAAAARAAYVGRTFGYSYDFLADAKIFGNLIPNLYQGGIGFNLGYEYRHSRNKQIPDPTQAAGDQLGFNAASPFSYHQEVNAYFGELQIPVVTSAMNIPGVRSLEFQAAYRYEEFKNQDQFGAVDPDGDPLGKRRSKFDNNGDVRLSVRYQPVQDVTLRASFGESFLSPSPNSLFAPASETFPQVFDPATGRTLQPAEGVIQGGNTLLKPETTETYTAGIVVTPKFLPGFTATADLYQLFTRNVILPSSDFAQLILTQNGNAIRNGTPINQAPFADLIDRDEGAVPIPNQIRANTANAGKRLVNGLDVTAAYQLPSTNFGTFTLSLGYNYFFTWKAEPVEGSGSANFLGNYNNGTLPLAPGAIPRHKGFLRGEYEWKGLNFVATTNYISSFLDDPGFILASEFSPNGERDLNTRTVSDYITLDMQLSYEFIKPEMDAAAAGGYSKDAKGGKSMQSEVAGVENNGSFFQRMLWGTKIRVGVVNAFDRQPPTVLGAFNDNYDTSLYSIRNRYYYVGINKKF
ncbi:MAG: TonB-dependent receptor [Verrucomicrobiota bacterium]|nr:TonB-dependent receptor [Verrucomicrobiota bacterium]